MRGLVGTNAEVLFERRGRESGQIVGRSPWLMPVHVDAPESLIGTIGRVVITGAGTNSLFATIASAGAESQRLGVGLEIAF
jgi:tRNA-2-methylthio-N6-dimethylallyladenosine synthase